MADERSDINSETSPEEIAFRLMGLIHHLEGHAAPKDRKSVLDLYAECLLAVRDPR